MPSKILAAILLVLCGGATLYILYNIIKFNYLQMVQRKLDRKYLKKMRDNPEDIKKYMVIEEQNQAQEQIVMADNLMHEVTTQPQENNNLKLIKE